VGNPERVGVPRRDFLKKGLLGALLLAVGGGTAIALWPTRRAARAPGNLKVFTAQEYAILAAVARRVVAAREGDPSPDAIDVAGRADAAIALAHPSVQKELKQLLHLFENGLTGLFTGSSFAPFTASSGRAQDARLAAWATSRVALFRTGYQAMKRLTAACYWSHPDTWKAIGYPGPPDLGIPDEAFA
jgi:hypothetical protein